MRSMRRVEIPRLTRSMHTSGDFLPKPQDSFGDSASQAQKADRNIVSWLFEIRYKHHGLEKP